MDRAVEGLWITFGSSTRVPVPFLFRVVLYLFQAVKRKFLAPRILSNVWQENRALYGDLGWILSGNAVKGALAYGQLRPDWW
jgi:hypothetical protein